MFEYYVNYVNLITLPDVLTYKGLKGWRLHTCDIDNEHKMVFIVMDRFTPSDNAESENNEEKEEAMACKG